MSIEHSPNFDIIVNISPDAPRIINRLSKLTDKMQKKVAVAAARKSMAPVRKAAIENAKAFDDPATPERVWKNISIQNAPKSGRSIGGIYMRVGVRGGAKQYSHTKENVRKRRVGKMYRTSGDKGNPGGDTWYWRFLEFGTSKMRARKFLRDALEKNAQAVADIVTSELSAGLDKLAVEVGGGQTSTGK